MTQLLEKQKRLLNGGAVTEGGLLRDKELDKTKDQLSTIETWIGGTVFTIQAQWDAVGASVVNTSGVMTQEIVSLGNKIEQENRSMGTSFQAFWQANGDTVRDSAKIMAGAFGGVGQAMMMLAKNGDEINKKQFNNGKKFAIAEVVVNTALGVSEVWSRHASNPILASALTAGVLTIGAAQTAIIRAAKPGSSSSGSSSAGKAPNLISNYSNASQIPRAIPTGGFGPLFGASAQQYAGSNGFGSLSSVPPPSQRATTVDISLVAEGDQLIGVINDTYQQRVRTIGTGALAMGRGSQTRVVGIKNRFGDDGFNAGWRNP